MDVGRIEGTLALNVDDFDKGIDSAENTLKGLGGKFEEASTQMGGAFASVGPLLTAAIGGPVIAGFADATSAVFDFSNQSNQAARDLAASLGLPIEETERLSDVSKRVFGNNFAGDINEAATAVGVVRQQLGDLSDNELQKVTENAFRMSDAFGTDTTESVSAVKTLMENFGLTSDQAFDFLANGFQKGLDRSGDFLDTINEYSTQFSNGGADAGEFFSIIETGAAGGALGTDKAADAFKEFRIRITEGSDDVVDALATIGNEGVGKKIAADLGISGPLLLDTEENALAVQKALSAMGRDVSLEDLMRPLTDIDAKTGEITIRAKEFGDVFSSEIMAGIEDGSISAMDAQSLVIDGLGAMDNKVFQNSAGVALMGGQWEDMGADSVLAMNTTNTSLEDMQGAISSVDTKYGSLSATWEGVKRSALVALSPIADKLLAIANEFMPILSEAFVGLGTIISGAVDVGIAAFDFIQPIIQTVIDTVKNLFAGNEGGSLFGISPDDPIIATLGTIRDTFILIWAQVQAVIAQIAPMIQMYVMDVFSGLVDFITANQANIMTIITGAWEVVQGVIQVAVAIIQNIILPAFQLIYEFIATHYSQIQAIIQAAWDIISAIVGTVINIVKGIIQTVLAIIAGDWAGAWEGMKDILSSIWDGVKAIIRVALDLIKGALSLAWDIIKSTISLVWGAIVAIITTAWQTISGTISAGLTAIGGFLSSAWQTISGGATTTWNYIKTDVVGAAWQAISGTVSTVLSTITSAISTAWDTIKGGAQIAWDSIKGIVSDTWDSIIIATNNVISTIRGVIDGAKSIFENAFSGAMGGISNIVSSILRGVVNSVINIINGIIDATNALIYGMNLVNPLEDIAMINNIPAYAAGTDFARGGMALVGERGPELVNLPRGSQVIPNHALSGGGDTYILNVYTNKELSSISDEYALMKVLRGNV